MMDREQFIEHLRDKTRVLTNDALEKAFTEIDRADFLPEDYKVEAYEDYAIPIGHGQTISQPSTVAFMIELLDPQEGDEILDIGSGSGYLTALLARMVGNTGSVLGLEVLPELAEFGQANIAKYDFLNARIEESDPRWSAIDDNFYDRIIVSAASEEYPEALISRLKPGGVLVVPIGESIVKFSKIDEVEIDEEEFPGFAFVPLV